MLLVTFHGGKPEKNPKKNNVHAYDKKGKRISSAVLEDVDGIILDELRGIQLVGNRLYVANANRTQNNVLCYEGSETKYRFLSKFVTSDVCKGILHPFDFTFDDAGQCYVSSQDTNLVTRLKVSADRRFATPTAVAPALPSDGVFLPGTFVASSVGNLGGTTTPVPAPARLTYSDSQSKKHSVRGVAWVDGALYVVDQPAGRVKVYDRDGKLLGQSNSLESPVHLMVNNGTLYVSGSNEVLSGKLPKPPGNIKLSPIKSIKVKNSGGMAFSPAGHFYLASRTENIILKFDSDFTPMKFLCELPDNPEFLLHVESSA